MARDSWITVYLTKVEKQIIKKKAQELAYPMAEYMRWISLEFANGNLRKSNALDDFGSNSEILERLEELKSEMQQLRDLYDFDIEESNESISRIQIPVDTELRDKILMILGNHTFFIEDICEKGGNLDISLTLKTLVDMKNEHLVNQDQNMRWFKL